MNITNDEQYNLCAEEVFYRTGCDIRKIGIYKDDVQTILLCDLIRAIEQLNLSVNGLEYRLHEIKNEMKNENK